MHVQADRSVVSKQTANEVQMSAADDVYIAASIDAYSKLAQADDSSLVRSAEDLLAAAFSAAVAICGQQGYCQSRRKPAVGHEQPQVLGKGAYVQPQLQ